ncbi:Hypothetical_protein [Hexamita inflata]|uniref:Hypothetical_protein n=1 Tax=Hexamita inflata TaxID=28002 RepID=A0AA86NJT6_9EUKA|nr:Hypothetical protein HINF_LOCUS8982 [Hexamita inflata]
MRQLLQILYVQIVQVAQFAVVAVQTAQIREETQKGEINYRIARQIQHLHSWSRKFWKRMYMERMSKLQQARSTVCFVQSIKICSSIGAKIQQSSQFYIIKLVCVHFKSVNQNTTSPRMQTTALAIMCEIFFSLSVDATKLTTSILDHIVPQFINIQYFQIIMQLKTPE